MAPPHQSPRRKQSFLRTKIRESFRPSAFFHHSEKDGAKAEKPRTSVDGKRVSMEESSWIVRKRRKSKMLLKEEEEPVHSLSELKIDVGGFEDLKMSLDPGTEMYSLKSPEPAMSPAPLATATKETVVSLQASEKPLMQKLNQYSPIKDQKMTFPSPMELEDTSSNIRTEDVMEVDPQPSEPQPEIRKGPKWQIKTDNLVRPVSSGRASALSGNISQTIAAINKNNFHATAKWNANIDSMASTRQSMESNRSKLTSQTNGTDKVDSVIGSNASFTTIQGTTRRPLGDTARINTNRHTVADGDKLLSSQSAIEQENKRQSFPPVAVRRQSLVNMNSAQQSRPKSPTGSIASTATGAPRARRQSGTNVSSRLSWLQDLENKKTPGQEYMLNKLQGGVADKLRRFESQNGEASGSTLRSQSATRSSSTTRGGSDAYGIERKRLSRTVTADDDFRKKLEEQFLRKQQADEEKEQKQRNRASLPVTGSKTPQQIIDYVELNDNDREAGINELMKHGQGLANAKRLDTQAKAALSGPHQPNAVFQNASTALRSTTNLLETLNAPPKGALKSSATSLQRTMSVQQKSRKVSPINKAPRPVSYAPPTPMSMDDEYDPFNYAVYPSRSSIYSNPPEAPAMTPEIEHSEDEVLRAGGDGSSDTLMSDAAIEPIEVEKEAMIAEEPPMPEIAVDAPSSRSEESSSVPERPSTNAEMPEAAPTPAASAPASGWAARFSAPPAAKSKTATALPPRLTVEKPSSLSTGITSAPREGDADLKHAISSEELVAREAVPASPTLVDIPSRPSSKRTTPVKDKFATLASIEDKATTDEIELSAAKADAQPAMPQKKQAPSSLLVSNDSVKIASPCSSPKSPRQHEFNAAALPRLGMA